MSQRWRVDLVLAIGAVLIAWLLWLDAPGRKLAAVLFFVIYPILTFVLLHGAIILGLPIVSTDRWGGIFVSLLVAITGIVVSLPLGILLALGRRSSLPVLHLASVIFIEVMRGVPMITVLFMANTMLPLIVPENLAPDRLLRPLIGVALFASAYMAEVVRGGLQAVPKGQGEAAQALGLRRTQIQRFVILPQALAFVIPGIVNTFIGLFKDTTLVAIVGIFDFLRTVDTARLDPAWAGPTITPTAYIFAALFYFVFCFGMSRYSSFIESRVAKGQKH
jgi:general L-amino acid transport system permease protein